MVNPNLNSIRRSIQVLVWIVVLVLTFALFKTATAVCWTCPLWFTQYLASSQDTGLPLALAAGWTPPMVQGAALFGLFIFTGLVFGRIFCGFVCPLGSLLERAEEKSPFRIRPYPGFLDRRLKYFALGITVFLAWYFGRAIFCLVCPAGFLFKSITGVVVASSLVVFSVVFLATLFYGWKFWCGALCPLGAFNALLTAGQLFAVRHRGGECRNCRTCEEACPTGVEITSYKQRKEVKDPECLLCLKCVEACPNHELGYF